MPCHLRSYISIYIAIYIYIYAIYIYIYIIIYIAIICPRFVQDTRPLWDVKDSSRRRCTALEVAASASTSHVAQVEVAAVEAAQSVEGRSSEPFETSIYPWKMAMLNGI